MDLRQLRYFVAAADAGSLMKASKRLHVAQPALSVHLSNLEIELGVALVTRGQKGITLTEDGAILYERAISLLREYKEMVMLLKGRKQKPQGLVSIGLPSTLPAAVVTPLFRAVRDELPEVRLYIAEGSSALVYDWLHEGNVDLAVLYSLPDNGYLELTPLYMEDFCLVSAPQTAGGSGEIDFDSIFSYPIATGCGSTAWRKILDNIAAQHGKRLDVAIETESWSALRALALSGDCFSLMPRLCILQDVIEGRLVARKIVNPDIRACMSVATLSNKAMSLAARNVKEIIVEVFRLVAHELHLPSSAPPAAHLMHVAPSTLFPLPPVTRTEKTAH